MFPILNPPSHLPPHTILPGHPSAPAPSILYWTWTGDSFLFLSLRSWAADDPYVCNKEKTVLLKTLIAHVNQLMWMWTPSYYYPFILTLRENVNYGFILEFCLILCWPLVRFSYQDAYAAAAKSLQSCPTLCDPIDGSPPGSPVPGILRARTLEWVAISFSNAWKWKVKVKLLSRVWLLATPWTAAYQAPPSMDFPGKSTGVGCHCLLRNS